MDRACCSYILSNFVSGMLLLTMRPFEIGDQIVVRELGQDDVIVEVRFWTGSRRSDYLATASAVRLSAIQALREAGVGLPDPDVRFLVPRQPQRWERVFRRGTTGPDAENRPPSPPEPE